MNSSKRRARVIVEDSEEGRVPTGHTIRLLVARDEIVKGSRRVRGVFFIVCCFLPLYLGRSGCSNPYIVPLPADGNRRRSMHDAASRAHGFGLAVELVAVAFDVVGGVDDDDGVAVKGSFHGGVLCCAGVFLVARGQIDAAREVQGVSGDQMQA